mmetsp:Transcript_29229/g.62971  ORF Transcript_29229/g.62971 Transcript_29229/m.62971 type:complete len:296 (+) Transcript_29229:139-1026(+)
MLLLNTLLLVLLNTLLLLLAEAPPPNSNDRSACNIPKLPISVLTNNSSLPAFPVIYTGVPSRQWALAEQASRHNLLLNHGAAEVTLSSSNAYSHGKRICSLAQYILTYVDARSGCIGGGSNSGGRGSSSSDSRSGSSSSSDGKPARFIHPQVLKMFRRAQFLLRNGDNSVARKLLLRCLELNSYDSHRWTLRTLFTLFNLRTPSHPRLFVLIPRLTCLSRYLPSSLAPFSAVGWRWLGWRPRWATSARPGSCSCRATRSAPTMCTSCTHGATTNRNTGTWTWPGTAGLAQWRLTR